MEGIVAGTSAPDGAALQKIVSIHSGASHGEKSFRGQPSRRKRFHVTIRIVPAKADRTAQTADRRGTKRTEQRMER